MYTFGYDAKRMLSNEYDGEMARAYNVQFTTVIEVIDWEKIRGKNCILSGGRGWEIRISWEGPDIPSSCHSTFNQNITITTIITTTTTVTIVPYTNRSLSFISIDSTTSSSFDDHDRSGSGGVHPFHDLDIPTLLSPSYEEKEKVLFLPIDRCLDQPVISSRDKLLGSAPRKPLMRTRSSSPTDMYSKATPLDILKHKYRTQLPSKMDVDYSSFSTD
eukprot:scaffold1945_cov181-Ochromonas_danica.AAC.9